MQGNLILNTSSPTNDLQAASKGYVDSSVSKLLYSGNLSTVCGNQTTHTITGMSKCKVLLFHFYLVSNNSVAQLEITSPFGTIWATQSFAYSGRYNASILLMGPKKFDAVMFLGDNNDVDGDWEYNASGIQYSDTLYIDSSGNNTATPAGTPFKVYVEFFKIA